MYNEIRKGSIIMEQDGQMKEAVCYACFSNEATPIGEDVLTEFANAAIPQVTLPVKKSFIDINNKKSAKNRPNWNAMLEECEADGIKIVVVPAVTMLSYNSFDALVLAKDIKRKYGIDTYFLFENIFTGSENADKDISFYGMIQDYLDKQKKQKKKMKKLFAELTVSED